MRSYIFLIIPALVQVYDDHRRIGTPQEAEKIVHEILTYFNSRIAETANLVDQDITSSSFASVTGTVSQISIQKLCEDMRLAVEEKDPDYTLDQTQFCFFVINKFGTYFQVTSIRTYKTEANLIPLMSEAFEKANPLNIVKKKDNNGDEFVDSEGPWTFHYKAKTNPDVVFDFSIGHIAPPVPSSYGTGG